MKAYRYISSLFLACAAPLFAGVTVSSPQNNSTVTSPVTYAATATAPTCSKGVAAMGIYVNNQLKYQVNGASLNTQLTLSPGSYYTVVQEWDNCGASSTAPAQITVTSGTSTTVNMTASPQTIAPGGSSTLSVSAANATQVKVTGTDGSSYTLQPSGGTQAVKPTATTTYTATATGSAGNVTSTATVTVSNGGAAGVTLTSPANNSTVTSPVTYTATASAPSCASGVAAMGIYVNNQLKYKVNGASLNTQLTLSPGSYYTVVQEWDNCGGSLTSVANITVQAGTATTVSMTASPQSIASGGSSTLSVSAANATQVKVTGTDGSSYTLQPSGGTQVVKPTATTTYTATATGSAGNVTATATVTVGGSAAGVTLNSPANNSTVTSPVTYTATASAPTCSKGVAAMGIYVNNQLKYKVNGASLNTQLTLSPGSYYTVVQEWDNCGGSATAVANITVTASSATTVSMTASPQSITSGGSSTLSVSAANATQVKVTGTDGSSYTLQPTGGTQSVSPTATTTYTATATGSAGNVTATATVTVGAAAATVTLSANPTNITAGASSTLTVSATNASQVKVTGTDGSSYTLQPTGGTQGVTPTATTTYTATATGSAGNVTATATVTVGSSNQAQAINHVVFMLQENRSFDTYFGMLNPYRSANGLDVGADGKTYSVDGIDDKLTTISNTNDEGTSYSPFKLTSTCIDDMTSSWLESYGDVSRYDFSSNRQIDMDGFVHTAEDYDKYCAASNGGSCSGSFTDSVGKRTMGHYDQGFLNYYYYMASQFALSDRWFSPISSKSIPNRIATFTGGTTQGLAFDPGLDDHLPQLNVATIFEELDQSSVSWKIYYSATQGSMYPDTIFGYFSYSSRYLYKNSGGSCAAPTQPSSVVGDSTNSFCIDPNRIAPLSQYFTDLTNNALPSFAFIETAYGQSDEHPGSGQSILAGQQQVSKVVNAFMTSPEWSSSVFFLSYDEIGGTYDHVPPVPGHSNDKTDATVGSTAVGDIPDISTIAKNADGYYPCVPSGGTPTIHCDLNSGDPGAVSTDAPAAEGFAAQLGFRVPNMVISPFTRKHYVSHIPMDHTAVIKFVENRFIGPSAHLTARDDAQPNLLDFFDFTAIPWATPPTPPTPVSPASLGYNPCTPTSIGP